MESCIKPYHGAPTLFLDGTPRDGLAHWNAALTAADVLNFSKAGVEIFSFMGTLPGGPVCFTGTMPCPEFTPENIDSAMNEFVGANPGLYVIPRVKLLCPESWMTRHPEEIMRHYDIAKKTFVQGFYPSLTSPLWREYVTTNLEKIVTHFETRWGDRVLGYHVGAGHCGEHVYRWAGLLSDYGPAHLAAFRRWCSGKYGTVETLNRVWKTDLSSFDAIPAPAPERFLEFSRTARAVVDPELHCDLIDWTEFLSVAMVDTVLLEAKTVKNCLRKLGRVKLFGSFYGYSNLPANSNSWYSLGMYAQETILNSPDIDFLSAPISYTTRQEGGVSAGQLLPGAVRAHGKLYYAEEDTGTFVSAHPHHGLVPRTPEEYFHVAERNFADIFRSGGTLWWMDLYGTGWFRNEKIMKKFAELRKFMLRHSGDRRGTAEIAVFVSDGSMKYFSGAGMIGTLINRQISELGAVGAPFDLFNLEDLNVLDLAPYKFCVVLNALETPGPLLGLIDRKMKSENKTVLWIYAPGLIRDGKFDLESMTALTGMKFLLKDSGTESMQVEAMIQNRRISFGTPVNYSPKICGNDPEAESLGFYIDGTSLPGNRSGLMRRKFETWTSVWSAVPNVPSELLADLAREAGVRIYAEGHQVFAGPRWMMVHAKFSGLFPVRMPDGAIREIPVKRGENYFFPEQ